MSNPANSDDGLGTLHKSSAHLVFKSQTNYVDHSKDGQVYDGSSISIERLDNEARNDTNNGTIAYDNTPAVAVSPTDNSIPTPVMKVATHGHNSTPTHTMHTESTPKRTLQKHITPNKQLTGCNWSNDNGTKASSEEAAQEVVPQQKHKSNLEMFDKLQFLEKQPPNNNDGIEMKKNGLSIDYSKRVTFQGDIVDRIDAVPTTVSKIFTKKYPKEDNGLTCPHCAKGFVSQGGLDYHILLACQIKLPNSTINIRRKRKLPKGVYETPLGNYQVQVYYQGRSRCIGSFQTLEQATLASEIVRSMLEKDKGMHLSAKECERNIKLAKEAALKVEDGSISPQSGKSGLQQAEKETVTFNGDIENKPAKDGIRKKSRSKGEGGRIAKITSDYWQHGLQTSVTFKEDNGLTCPICTKEFASQGGFDYHVEKKVCHNKFTNSTIIYLNECSSLNPYPGEDQIDRICTVTGLSNMQVEDWMASARKKPRKKSDKPSIRSVRNRNTGVQTTIKELEAYMKIWISKNAFSRDWVLNLIPSPSQKDQIILDTGVERYRLEGWLYG